MTVNNVKKLGILRRRERIYELHLQGKTQIQIAEETGASQANVSRDLQLLQNYCLEDI